MTDKERNCKYYESLTPERKERRFMHTARHYYLSKGTIPAEHTSLGRYCIKHGLDIVKVMNGEQKL